MLHDARQVLEPGVDIFDLPKSPTIEGMWASFVWEMLLCISAAGAMEPIFSRRSNICADVTNAGASGLPGPIVGAAGSADRNRYAEQEPGYQVCPMTAKSPPDYPGKTLGAVSDRFAGSDDGAPAGALLVSWLMFSHGLAFAGRKFGVGRPSVDGCPVDLAAARGGGGQLARFTAGRFVLESGRGGSGWPAAGGDRPSLVVRG